MGVEGNERLAGLFSTRSACEDLNGAKGDRTRCRWAGLIHTLGVLQFSRHVGYIKDPPSGLFQYTLGVGRFE